MKRIDVFIASSAELKSERMELVDLMQDLNDELETKGVNFKPVLWEYMDSSMRAGRKEDEYLVKLRECEICIVLFWRTLGEYTAEELNVAVTEMQAGRLPKKVYVLFKEPADDISEELASFKKDIIDNKSLYPISYNSIQLLRKHVEAFLKEFVLVHTVK